MLHSPIGPAARHQRRGRRNLKLAGFGDRTPAAPQDFGLLETAYRNLYRSLGAFEDSGVEGISAGARIETMNGLVPVQMLKPGDLIRTADAGYLPLLWKGGTRKSGKGRDAPVLVQSGRLGNSREIIVSPRQKLLLTGPQVEMLFSKPEVLVPARNLVNDHSIWRLEMEEVVYFNLLLERHSIIFSDGCRTESMHLATLEWQTLSQDIRATLVSALPEGASISEAPLTPAARPVLNVYEACLIRALM